MIGRVVITSVPQGIGGGSGFQPVLRTQGLKPSIAERLAMRASYPHPFSFGDRRNPRVLFHRIETVGDRTIHILGSVRDAGSSYTGRSNHLAELIAIDPAETRGLPGGPVFVAQSLPWLGRWAGEPREVPLTEEPVVPANDPACSSTSSTCVAWAAAAGDPGWAGELAKSFLDGRRAVIWVDEGVDAGALFAEAARLLPASARWQVEFNTCEIEPFPAHWRALRPDLPVVGPRPASGDLVLDLAELKKNCRRGPDHALASLARGEAVPQTTQGDPQIASATTSPGGTPKGVADEAALRARLQEISEDRRRRSHQDSAVRTDPWDRETMGLSWRPAVIVGSFLLICCGLSLAFIVAARTPDRSRPVASESSAELRSRVEEQDLREKKQNGKDDLADRGEARAVAKRNDEKEQKRLAIEADLRRKQETADSARKEQVAREAAEKKNAEASEAAIKAFNSVPDRQTIPLVQTIPDKALCSFDAEHLIDPTCDLAIVDSEAIRISIKRDPATSHQPPTWTVTGSQFDSVSGLWVGAVVVCRLVVREGSIWLEWPNADISEQHDFFRVVENGMLLVSCRNTTGHTEIRREILFAEPIDLASVNNDVITLDPLAVKDTVKLDYRLAERLRVIPPSALHWSIELTHPKWTGPQKLHDPDTVATVQLPSAALPGVKIGYMDVDPKSGVLVPLIGPLRIEATVQFTPHGARFSLDPKVTGLDNVPLLKPVIRTESLQKAYRGSFELDPLERAIQRVLEKRLASKQYSSLAFDAFLQKSAEAQKDGITNTQTLDDRKQELEREHAAIKVPGTNYPKPGSSAFETYRDTEKFNTEIAKWNLKNAELKQIYRKLTRAFENDHTSTEAKQIREALEANSDWFGPITVEIESIHAATRDSNGRLFAIPIVKP